MFSDLYYSTDIMADASTNLRVGDPMDDRLWVPASYSFRMNAFLGQQSSTTVGITLRIYFIPHHLLDHTLEILYSLI